MKKILALTATAALALSLAACDWGTANKTDAPVLNEETVVNEGATLNETAPETETGTTNEALGNTTDGNALDPVDGNATAGTSNTL